ncbi:hypothetical protein [Halorubrum laminariae]|uniref:Integral membrane protein n=1 Tax=Halorubrum laminariae TaxID=1433523 RepID=A0ABD6BWI1_9EURY|nr:hypothetical protein [Halorubrum laminariae]
MTPSLDPLFPLPRTVVIGLLGGLVSLSVASALWLRFGFTTRTAGNGQFLIYVGLGAIALGAVPAILAAAYGLVAPLVVHLAIGGAAAYGTWTRYVAPETPPAPVGPTPFGWFLLGWVAVVALGLVAGWGEHRLRRRRVTR